MYRAITPYSLEMQAYSPPRHTFMMLCFAGAGLLAAGAWQEYQDDVERRLNGLFAYSGAYAMSGRLQYAPGALQTRGNRVVIRLKTRKLLLYKGDDLEKRYPIAVGQKDWATPIGSFTVQDMRIDPVWRHPITDERFPAGPDNPLGSRWISFWSDGEHYIGLHGTNEEELIGTAASHGCVRMREADIQDLYERISLGTPIVVQR